MKNFDFEVETNQIQQFITQSKNHDTNHQKVTTQTIYYQEITLEFRWIYCFVIKL